MGSHHGGLLPWGHKELDTTEQLTHTITSLKSCLFKSFAQFILFFDCTGSSMRCAGVFIVVCGLSLVVVCGLSLVVVCGLICPTACGILVP